MGLVPVYLYERTVVRWRIYSEVYKRFIIGNKETLTERGAGRTKNFKVRKVRG